MDCADTRRMLSAYLDGELDETRSHEFLAHLHSCAECKTVFNTFVKTVELYDGLPKPLLSDTARAELKRAVELD